LLFLCLSFMLIFCLHWLLFFCLHQPFPLPFF
jgi:hypothetical protein